MEHPGEVDERLDADRSEWEVCYDDDDDVDELKFRCSSALGDWTPPLTNSAEISTCEPIQRHDQVSPPGEIFDEPLSGSSEVLGIGADAQPQSGYDTERDVIAGVCDDAISQIGQEDGGRESELIGGSIPTSSGHVDAEVSRPVGRLHAEPEVDSRRNVGKRVTSDRRCRRREKVYGGKRRRRSPHPSSVYRLSVASPPKPGGLWQPWQDDRGTVEPAAPSLQTALENLRCLSVLSTASSIHHDASASAVETSTTGNASSSFVNRMTSSAAAMGN